jgi:hypothetical protein
VGSEQFFQCLLPRFSLLTIGSFNSAYSAGSLFCRDPHESGTDQYIIDLTVPPPQGSFGFSYFFIITGEGFLIGVKLPCSFRCIKQLSCFALSPLNFFIPLRCRPWWASGLGWAILITG